MSEMSRKPYARDYSKPILPKFSGEKGYRAFVKIVTTPPMKFDAKAAAEAAAENLRKQGIDL